MQRVVPDRMPDDAALLCRARGSDLRTSSTADLRAIRTDLETACETARLAAIGTLLTTTSGPLDGNSKERNCGFAGLFSALRRVKAELNRRTPQSGPACSGAGNARPSDGPKPARDSYTCDQ